jgi:hypothetical protein
MRSDTWKGLKVWAAILGGLVVWEFMEIGVYQGSVYIALIFP